MMDDGKHIDERFSLITSVFLPGIAFLRGFQVSLQHLGGSRTACQLLLFHRNVTLQASHAHMVRKTMLLFLPFSSSLRLSDMAMTSGHLASRTVIDAQVSMR